MDLEAEIDRLYSLPLDDFIASRDAIAKTLRAEGERGQADEVKRFSKPNLPAWAVNQLWYRERETFERLLKAGKKTKRPAEPAKRPRTRAAPAAPRSNAGEAAAQARREARIRAERKKPDDRLEKPGG